ncbi:MAG: cation:proton antiporter [Bacteroidales bacterium]|nr:cation:proton antiporter [Bacteroidales bacterium]
MFISAIDFSLPIANPVLKFFLILVIILFAPIILNKIKIPHLLGLIIAGAVIGPFGLNLMQRDSSIILSGTAGLLYIMFLAGLEIDIADFKKNIWKSTILGLYGFLIPMLLGTLSGMFILGFSLVTSLLLASMFASHTLITYPLVGKFGIVKNRAVNISVGSTLITNVLALLVLAVIANMYSGGGNNIWLRLPLSVIVFSLIVIFLFPMVGRWFLKNYSDSVSQYIFILAMVFFGALLAEVAGIEAIIGAFIAGLSLNRLVPVTSPLMNRINFVGNAVFIPFFLIGVGMLLDYKAFFVDIHTIKVAVVMSVIATGAKYLAAFVTQKSLNYTNDERLVIFGLTNSQAAATLAAVLVGYNIVTGYTTDGLPIRLLNESVLNGTIIMILITCTIASFATQKAAYNIAFANTSIFENEEVQTPRERLLIPLGNPDTAEELINMSIIVKSKKSKEGLFALNVIDNSKSEADAEKKAHKILEKAEIFASATDCKVNRLLRYDSDIVNAVTSVVKENNITDLVMGLHMKKAISESFLGNLTEGILSKCNITTFVYKSFQPISTINRHLVFIPDKAEREAGFTFWLAKIWNIARNTGAKMLFYGTENTLFYIHKIYEQHHIEAEFIAIKGWNELFTHFRDVRGNDGIVLVLSRKNKASYHHKMPLVPEHLNNYCVATNFIIIYPVQSDDNDHTDFDLRNPSLIRPVEQHDDFGKTIGTMFN